MRIRMLVALVFLGALAIARTPPCANAAAPAGQPRAGVRVPLTDELACQPQFGVDGVPSMTVIDHRGVVRAVDLNPRQAREKTVALLDRLLAEREAALLVAPND